jgi:hypothetical protein
MKTARLLLALGILTALPGCGWLVTSYHDATAWTSRQWSAEKAWRVRKWMYADIPCRGSFKSGFKAGYRFASGGYDSCEPPQLRHYWRIGELTASERRNAQAWSDGFTHGTLAAQQDHAASPSALDAAAMQPPEGVPDVRYYVPPQMSNEMDQGAPYSYAPNWQPPASFQVPPGYEDPQTNGSFPSIPSAGNFQNMPGGSNYLYSPPTGPPPAPASEAMPGPSLMPYPPPAPGSQPAAEGQYRPGPMTTSEGSPGIGSLRTADNIQPAPPAESLPQQDLPQQAVGSPPQATQATDWELPLIRG